MIIGENIYSLLLVEKFFKTFTADKEISDVKRNTEFLNAISIDSREEFRTAQDHGWMYGRAFEDLDRHI
jgi:predicted lactoylglutathione lyase